MNAAPERRILGVPVRVSRIVGLPRAPTEREWEQLVSFFRTTFGTQGKTSGAGGLREWSSGTLHISLEATEHGEQLRLTSLKDDAEALTVLSVVMGGVSVFSGVVGAASGSLAKALVVAGVFGGTSLVVLGANLARLPRWARDRGRQLEAVGEQALKLLSSE